MKLNVTTSAPSRLPRLLCALPALLLAAIAGCSSNNNGTAAKAFPIVTWTTPLPIAFGVPLSATQLNAYAYSAGTLAYSPAAGTVLPIGTNTLSVTFTPTDTTNYQPVTQQVSLIVEPAVYTYANVQMIAGGFIDGIVQHPTTQNLAYLRTDIGGAYKYVAPATAGATGTWTPLLDFLPASQDNYLGVESIALDPTNPQKLYLAVGTYAESFGTNGAFLLSSNQGSTFTIVPAPFKMGSNDNGRNAGERLAVDPNQPATLYFGSRLNGLWKSTNSGTSWSQVTSFPVLTTTSGVGIVFVDFVTASGTSGSATPVIYVGVSDAGAAPNNYATLYRSTDAGNTWAAVPGAPAGVTGLYVNHGVLGPDSAANTTALYMSYGNGVGPSNVTAGALYKYTLPPNSAPTGAGTWTNISVPTGTARLAGAQGGYGGIVLDPEVPGVVMASTLDDYFYSGNFAGDDIYRSTNYGATWVSLSAQGKTNNGSLSPWLAFGGSNITNVGTGNWPVALAIDPFNSAHFFYGTGQTLWTSTNVTASDLGTGPSFSVAATGVEECEVFTIASPPAGGYLISGLADIGGFVHTSLTASPTGGMSANPVLTGTTGLDFAQASPLNVVRVGQHQTSSGTVTPPHGAVSTTGGQTSTSWTPFANMPAGTTKGNGTVAMAADASSIVWATSDAPVAWSADSGTTWTASTGAIAQGHVYSDRVNPKKFYILSGTTLQISTDGGHTFTNANTSIPANSQLTVSFAAEGDLWLATPTGLQQSTNSGTTFNAISGLSSTSNVGFGKAATGATYPAIYAVGTGAGGYGFYRSVNAGATWVQINNTTQLYANISQIVGDEQVFGRFYLATNGRGIPYGSSLY
jgi:hypothetical protein